MDKSLSILFLADTRLRIIRTSRRTLDGATAGAASEAAASARGAGALEQRGGSARGIEPALHDLVEEALELGVSVELLF